VSYEEGKKGKQKVIASILTDEGKKTTGQSAMA
jgi:hypothetical protein